MNSRFVKNIFIAVLLSVSFGLNAQHIYKIKTDSLLVTNDSCTAEFNLENRTKDTLGFLYNKGKGRTEFRRGLKKVNDSIYIIGADTLNIAKGGSINTWKLNGNTGIDSTANFLGTADDQPIIFKTNNTERIRLFSGGKFLLNQNTDAVFNGTARFDSSVYFTKIQKWSVPFAVTNGLLKDTSLFQYVDDSTLLKAPKIKISETVADADSSTIVPNTNWVKKNFIKTLPLGNIQTGSFQVSGNSNVTITGQYPVGRLSGNTTAALTVTHGAGNYGLAVARAATDLSPANFTFYRVRGTNINGKSPLLLGDQIGRINWQAQKSNDSLATVVADIYTQIDSITSQFPSTTMFFRTIPRSGSVGNPPLTNMLQINYGGHGSTRVIRLNISESYTPTDSSDPYGVVGDVTRDNDYIYMKTSAGWKRSAVFSTF